MYCGPQRLSRRKAFRAAARLTGRLPIAGTNECRFVRWMQSERETDEKERSFEGTRCPTMLAKVGISGTVGRFSTVVMHLNGMGAPRSSPLKRSASWSRLPLNIRRCHPNRRSCRHLSSQNEKAMARKCETQVPIAHTPRHGGVDRAPGATHAGVDRAPPATRRCRSRTRRDTRGCRSRTPPCTRPSHGQIWQPTAATSLPPPPFWHQVPMAAPCTCSRSSTYGFPAVRSSLSL